ncbi:MAG: LuxR C-terminal-related transcriptional regulator [Betaproteobacteria bacterium]
MLFTFVDARHGLGPSPQPREVAAGLAKRASNQELAGALGVSANTLAHHIKQLFARLDTHDRQQMIDGVLDCGWPGCAGRPSATDSPPRRRGSTGGIARTLTAGGPSMRDPDSSRQGTTDARARTAAITGGYAGCAYSSVRALLRGLRDLGYVYGQDFVTEPRGSAGNPDRYPALAAELVRLPVGVIVAAGPSMLALKRAPVTVRAPSCSVRKARCCALRPRASPNFRQPSDADHDGA